MCLESDFLLDVCSAAELGRCGRCSHSVLLPCLFNVRPEEQMSLSSDMFYQPGRRLIKHTKGKQSAERNTEHAGLIFSVESLLKLLQFTLTVALPRQSPNSLHITAWK